MLPSIITLSIDKTPNVRISVAKLLSQELLHSGKLTMYADYESLYYGIYGLYSNEKKNLCCCKIYLHMQLNIVLLVCKIWLISSYLIHVFCIWIDYFTGSQNPHHDDLMNAETKLKADVDSDVRYFANLPTEKLEQVTWHLFVENSFLSNPNNNCCKTVSLSFRWVFEQPVADASILYSTAFAMFQRFQQRLQY